MGKFSITHSLEGIEPIGSAGTIYASSNFTVEENYVYNKGSGFIFGKSNYSTFSRNILIKCPQGLYLMWLDTSHNLEIKNNYITQSGGDGIYLSNSFNNSIVNNTISDSEKYGINELDGSHNEFLNNTITNTTEIGIITNLENSTYMYNNFINSGQYSAQDDGIANIFDQNYYDDAELVDLDLNGIPDNNYSIAGTANNVDSHPRMYAYGSNPYTQPPVITSNSASTNNVNSTGNSIEWEITESNPNFYHIYQNGSLIANNTWSGNIVINIDGLDLGSYNFTIVVYDLFGNIGKHTLIVKVVRSIFTDPDQDSSPRNNPGSTQDTANFLISIEFIMITGVILQLKTKRN